MITLCDAVQATPLITRTRALALTPGNLAQYLSIQLMRSCNEAY